MEGLSDAVFAFAVTLLVVATEVPRDYAGLIDVVRGFPAFIACFVLLMIFWNTHYRYFRRYGLEDRLIRTINVFILLLVLFSVYPLKFLFTLWFAAMFHDESRNHSLQTVGQLITLFRIYGAGLGSIWLLYAVLYRHALNLASALRLTPAEILLTRESMIGCLISAGTAALSILLTCFNVPYSWPGYVYFLISIGLTINGRWHHRKIKALPAAA